MGRNERGSVELDTLAGLAATVTEAATPVAAFAAADRAACTLIGRALFTVMAFDAPAMEVQRVYSSNPDAYPPGGRKRKRDTPWGRHVLERGLPFRGAGPEDIRAHFDDHALILRLGLESVMNVPVRVCGETIGTMNLLRAAARFTERDLAAAQVLAGLLAGPLARAAQK